MDETIKVASEQVSGMVIEAEPEQTPGKLVWEVEVVTPATALFR
ncbi:MAG: hypothetical protein KF693_17020 [Nitrospira sp.]|nr:hypothetical protein [Nitrospira sp.]